MSVAELTMALILALARRIASGDRSTRAGGWDRRGCTGMEISGKTLTLLGFGRIGRLVAARARAFHMQVVAYDPYLPPDAAMPSDSGLRLAASLAEALAAGDFVSVHLPLGQETRHLMNADRLARMKPGAYLINTARGDVVDEAALVGALRSGRLAGAGLDVYEREPQVSPELLAMENVVLLPHLGSATRETRVAMGMRALENLRLFFQGKPLRDKVV